ncbi:MAG TPA: S41 family peptidase [Anaerolineaceae bacterium]|nr:S41 family peptidase [Anaerolineaceae bacterium]
MRQRTSQLWVYLGLFIVQGVIVGLAFGLGYIYPHPDAGQAASRFPLFEQVYDLIAREGLIEMPAYNTVQYGMIRGLIEAYGDPYTSFLEPAQNELQSDQLAGRFGGIGARLLRDSDQVILIYPYPDSPALKAGIKDGDRLKQVDQLVITSDMGMDTIEAAIRGPVGERVELLLSRASDGTAFTAQVPRAEFSLPSVTWYFAPDQPQVGVVQLNVMAGTTPDEIMNAVNDLQARGATRFILDLRNNSGGLVDAGVNTARLFLREGQVIQQQYKGKEVETFIVDQPGQFSDLPLVILTNKNTASSAEIVAGSLQSHHRALIIGSGSYGKDTIQLVFDLADSSSLHITAARWWVPGLMPGIGAGGLTPDVLLPDDATDTDYLLAAIQNLLQ